MTFNQLRTFAAVVRNGSITGAANELFVSQAAVSSVLAGLKGELGVELVSRNGRGIKVTAAGLVLYRYSQSLLGLIEEARTATIAEASPERSLLRIGSVTTAGESLVPMWLRSYLAEHPEVEVRIEVGNRARVFELLEQHHVDLVIAGSPPAGRGFLTLATRAHNLVLVASKDSELAKMQELGEFNYDLLSKHTWLVRELGSGTRASVEELLEELSISPRMLTLGSNVALREAVELGVGVALLSSDAVAAQLSSGSLAELRFAPLPISKLWHIVTRADETIVRSAGDFATHLLRSAEVVVAAPFNQQGDQLSLLGEIPPFSIQK